MALIIDRQTKKKEKNMKATNILWDTDGDTEALENLPKEVHLPDKFTEKDIEEIADWLSDTYEVCPSAFFIREDTDTDEDTLLWDILQKHRGHKVAIVSYGDNDVPANIALECEDCGEVILDAGIYTICARKES